MCRCVPDMHIWSLVVLFYAGSMLPWELWHLSILKKGTFYCDWSVFPLQLWMIWEENKRVGRFNHALSSNVGPPQRPVAKRNSYWWGNPCIFYSRSSSVIFLSPDATEYSYCNIYSSRSAHISNGSSSHCELIISNSAALVRCYYFLMCNQSIFVL